MAPQAVLMTIPNPAETPITICKPTPIHDISQNITLKVSRSFNHVLSALTNIKNTLVSSIKSPKDRKTQGVARRQWPSHKVLTDPITVKMPSTDIATTVTKALDVSIEDVGAIKSTLSTESQIKDMTQRNINCTTYVTLQESNQTKFPRLPIEIWLSIIVRTSSSLKEFTEYSRISRLIRSICSNPPTKARIITVLNIGCLAIKDCVKRDYVAHEILKVTSEVVPGTFKAVTNFWREMKYFMKQLDAVDVVKALLAAGTLHPAFKYSERCYHRCPYNAEHYEFEKMWTKLAYDAKNYDVLRVLVNSYFASYYSFHIAAQFDDIILFQILGGHRSFEVDMDLVHINHGMLERNTPLHVAARFGSLNVAKLIVRPGAKLDSFNDDGMTPLHVAVKANQTEMVRFLANLGGMQLINQCANMPTGETALSMAASEQHVDLVKVLVDHGGDIYKRNSDGSTLLHAAAKSDSVEVLKFVLEPVEENKIAKAGQALKQDHRYSMASESMSPLWYDSDASVHIHPLDHGSARPRWTTDLNVVGGISLTTPLQDAARTNSLKSFTYLLQVGCVDNIDNLMYWACESGSVDIVKILLKKEFTFGSNTTCGATDLESIVSTPLTQAPITHEDWTPLTLAISNCQVPLVNFLLDECSVNSCTKSGKSPFYYAVGEMGNISMGKRLLACGADYGVRLNQKAHPPESPGFSALHRAVQRLDVEAVRFLVELWGDVNAETGSEHGEGLPSCLDANGSNPLHIIAPMGGPDLLRLESQIRGDLYKLMDIILIFVKTRPDWLKALNGENKTPVDIATITNKAHISTVDVGLFMSNLHSKLETKGLFNTSAQQEQRPRSKSWNNLIAALTSTTDLNLTIKSIKSSNTLLEAHVAHLTEKNKELQTLQRDKQPSDCTTAQDQIRNLTTSNQQHQHHIQNLSTVNSDIKKMNNTYEQIIKANNNAKSAMEKTKAGVLRTHEQELWAKDTEIAILKEEIRSLQVRLLVAEPAFN
ncbi:Nuclear factor NF-kappa-B p105 subunit [Blyttiomyces sp. JEL0837]|nr:Nuclear factor NF-kappa-B p105 subunit [Blyttiomyces sp. JEL0837]